MEARDAAGSITPRGLAQDGGLAASTSAQTAHRYTGTTKRPRSTERSTGAAPVGTSPSMYTCCRSGIPPRSSARCADQPSHPDQLPPGWPATRTQEHWIGRLATQSCDRLRLEPPTPAYLAILRVSESTPSPQSTLVHRNRPAMHRIRHSSDETIAAFSGKARIATLTSIKRAPRASSPGERGPVVRQPRRAPATALHLSPQ